MTLTPLFLALCPSLSVVFAVQERPPVVASQDSLHEARTELAEIRLLLGAKRDYAKARERLEALATTLAASTAAGAPELRTEVERLTLEVRRALGEATVQAGAASADRVEEAIRKALRAGDLDFVGSMGQRAASALQDAVRSDPDAYFIDPEADPLTVLMGIDALAASQVVGQLLEHDDFFWKKRLGRVFVSATSADGLWAAGTPKRWLGTGLQQAAERHVDDAEVGEAAMSFLYSMFLRGKRRSTVLEAAVERALHGEEAQARSRAKAMAANLLGVESFEALLNDPDGDLRDYSAETLRKTYPASRALLSHADDALPEVREQVAVWLTQTKPENWGEEGRQALERLLHDPEESVRDNAFSVLDALPKESEDFKGTSGATFHRTFYAQPLPDALYRSLVGQGFDLQAVPIVVQLPEPLCFELAEIIARGSDAGARTLLQDRLFVLPFWRAPEAMLPIVETLLASTREAERDRTEAALGALGLVPAGAAPLAEWLLAHPDAERLARMHKSVPFRSVRLAELDVKLAFPLLAQLFRIDREEVGRFFVRSSRGAPDWTPEQSRASRQLVQDSTQPMGLRLVALFGLLNEGTLDDDFEVLAGGVLEDPDWQAGPDWEVGILRNLLKRDLVEVGNALLLRILRDPSWPESSVIGLAECLRPQRDGAVEVVHAVLERGFEQKSWNAAVQVVLRAMKEVPSLADPALLTRAAQSELYSRLALDVIGALRDPRYLPLLSGIVAQPRDTNQLQWAAKALFGFLDAEAFEPILLAAAKVPDSEVRDQCLAHLEKIREYQEARDRWAARQAGGQARERVIGELLGQLGAKSDEVRVQAIRALATWEAREAMPKLIELTTSGSKAVAAAAREALGQLNAPRKE